MTEGFEVIKIHAFYHFLVYIILVGEVVNKHTLNILLLKKYTGFIN
jgi:hypothetical protein